MAPTPALPPASAPARRLDAAPDDDGEAPADGSWPRALAFLVLGVGLLGAGFWAVKPKPHPAARPATTAPAASRVAVGAAPVSTLTDTPAAAPPSPIAASAEAVIATGRLTGPPVDLRLTEGQPAALVVTADAPGEVHLHGYDLSRPTAPGAPARLAFTAIRTGRFPLEWHGPRGRHVELGVVEVYPPS